MRSLGTSEYTCPKASGYGVREGLAGDGGLAYQHLVAVKGARWVGSPRELLVMGPGKGWRPGPGGHRQPGSALEPTDSWAQGRDGGPLSQGSGG